MMLRIVRLLGRPIVFRGVMTVRFSLGLCLAPNHLLMLLLFELDGRERIA